MMRSSIEQLRRGPGAVRALTDGLTPDEWRWRPGEGKWSIVEVLGHLLDEERDDFRTRLRLTLEDPSQPWPPIDPPAAVDERDHQSADPAALFAAWEKERTDSLQWLDSLTGPRLDRVYDHPQIGPLRAGDLLLSWAAHDLLHQRQILALRFAALSNDSAPYSPGYAGPW